MIVCSWPVGDGLKEVILETGDKQNRKTAVIGDMTDWNMRHHTCFDNIASLLKQRLVVRFMIYGTVYNKETMRNIVTRGEECFVYFDVCENCFIVC